MTMELQSCTRIVNRKKEQAHGSRFSQKVRIICMGECIPVSRVNHSLTHNKVWKEQQYLNAE